MKLDGHLHSQQNGQLNALKALNCLARCATPDLQHNCLHFPCCFAALPWHNIPPHSFLKSLTRKTCSPLYPPFYFLSQEPWMTFSSHQHQTCELFAANLWSRSIGSMPAWGQQQNHRPFYCFFKGQKQRQLSTERVIRIAENCHANGCVIYFSVIGKSVSSWPALLILEAAVDLCAELRRLDMRPTVC